MCKMGIVMDFFFAVTCHLEPIQQIATVFDIIFLIPSAFSSPFLKKSYSFLKIEDQESWFWKYEEWSCYKKIMSDFHNKLNP